MEVSEHEKKEREAICNAVTDATKQIIADAEAVGIDFKVNDEIIRRNLTLNRIPDFEFQGIVYQLLYKVYISKDYDKKLIPKTWFDHLKLDICNKFPILFNYITIDYDEIRIEYKTVLPPNCLVDTPQKMFNLKTYL